MDVQYGHLGYLSLQTRHLVTAFQTLSPPEHGTGHDAAGEVAFRAALGILE